MKRKQKIKNYLKKISLLKFLVVFLRVFKNKYGIIKKVALITGFFSDYRLYKKNNTNKQFILKSEDLYPRIYDKTDAHSIDPVYFYQNTWCAKKIFENKPVHHFDVGSSIDLVSIVSQFIPTTMVDIRPIPLALDGLSFTRGSILNLPFKDNEIKSLSSICVIEHIGLGRYGDPLDQFGSEKAVEELKRVLAYSGNLYISVPVDKDSKVYFNAHRAFTRDHILDLFSPLRLIEEKYIYGNEIFDEYDQDKGFGTGLYHFIKN